MTVDTKFFYTNGMEVAVSAFDVSLKFMRSGTQTPDQSPAAGTTETNPKTLVLDALIVSMSPTHAKAMLPGLIQAVAQYEAQHGKIALGPDLTQLAAATLKSTETH